MPLVSITATGSKTLFPHHWLCIFETLSILWTGSWKTACHTNPCHQCWNVLPMTQLCSYPLSDLYKHTADINLNGCNFLHSMIYFCFIYTLHVILLENYNKKNKNIKCYWQEGSTFNTNIHLWCVWVNIIKRHYVWCNFSITHVMHHFVKLKG